MKGKHARGKQASRSERPSHRSRKAFWYLAVEGHLRKVWHGLGDVRVRLPRWICGYPLGEQPEWYRDYNHLGFSRADLADPRARRRGYTLGLAGLDSLERKHPYSFLTNQHLIAIERFKENRE